MKTLAINYGINRRRTGKKSGFEHINGTLQIRGSWSSDETHQAIRQVIRDTHPGWQITGYAIAPKARKVNWIVSLVFSRRIANGRIRIENRIHRVLAATRKAAIDCCLADSPFKSPEWSLVTQTAFRLSITKRDF